MSENQFPKGIYFNKPHENAPSFVLGKISIKVEEAIPFLQEMANSAGYVNLDLKEAKSGHKYLQVDTWQPSGGGQQSAPSNSPQQSGGFGSFKPPESKPSTVDFEDDIPF